MTNLVKLVKWRDHMKDERSVKNFCDKQYSEKLMKHNQLISHLSRLWDEYHIPYLLD